MHSRANLINFFNDCEPPNSKNSVARHFTDSAYSPFGGKSPKQNHVYGKLNKQISHLTYDRTDNDDEKIRREDRHYLRNLIEDELDNFRQHIRDPYRKCADGYHGDCRYKSLAILDDQSNDHHNEHSIAGNLISPVGR